MLVAAVDLSGTTNIYAFRSEAEDDLHLDERNSWETINGMLLAFNNKASKKACEGVEPGTRKVIDLSASKIVHVAPPKTPVQELVELCEEWIVKYDGMGVSLLREHVTIIKAALARVKEEK